MPSTDFESTSLCLVEEDDLRCLVAVHYRLCAEGLRLRIETIVILDRYGCVVDCGEM